MTEQLLWDSHGRDNRLYVWQVSLAKLDGYSTITPLDKEDTSRQSPWLLHSLPVNALNFCAFSFCSKPDTDSLSTQPNAGRERSIILALAGTADHEIDVMELPSESLLSTIPAIQDTKTGECFVKSLSSSFTSNVDQAW